MNLRYLLLLAGFSAICICSPSFGQGEVGDALAPDATPKLSATLTTDELSASAQVKESDIIVVDVINNGKRPLLLDGDSAQIGGQTPLSQYAVMPPPPKNTLPEDSIEVGASLGTMGIANVAVDHINKTNNPGPAFYGKDDKRRKLAETRFGQRLLYPGENSHGEMFVSAQALSAGSISIPVYSHPDGARLGNLIITVAGRPASQAVSSQSAASDFSNSGKRRESNDLVKSASKKEKRQRE